MTFQKPQLKISSFFGAIYIGTAVFQHYSQLWGAYQTRVCVKQNFMVSVFYYILPLVIYIHLYIMNSDISDFTIMIAIN